MRFMEGKLIRGTLRKAMQTRQTTTRSGEEPDESFIEHDADAEGRRRLQDDFKNVHASTNVNFEIYWRHRRIPASMGRKIEQVELQPRR